MIVPITSTLYSSIVIFTIILFYLDNFFDIVDIKSTM